MIFLSIGLPGRFAEWCEALIARLAGRSGTVLVKAWPPLADMLGYEGISSVLDEVALALIGAPATHLVIGARQPDERLRAGLAETGVPFLLALDDPRNALADLLAKTNCDLNMAVRAIANCCPFVMRYAAMPQSVALRAARESPQSAAAKIARYLGMDASEREIEELTRAPAEADPACRPGGSDEWLRRVPASAHRMVSGALAAYDGFFAGGKLGQIVWNRELFKLGDDPGKSPNDVVDLAGGARNLVFGPYIYLPAGSWNARVHLGFSPEATGHTFLVDAYVAGRQLACTSFQPTGSGTYSPDITFSLDEGIAHGLEIRVIAGDDNSRGQLAFGNVVLSPLAIREPDAIKRPHDDFRAVLDL